MQLTQMVSHVIGGAAGGAVLVAAGLSPVSVLPYALLLCPLMPSFMGWTMASSYGTHNAEGQPDRDARGSRPDW